jgi:hypothetical protein
MDDPTAITATEDRLAIICDACDWIRGVMLRAVAEGDASPGEVEAELELVTALRDEALAAESERALVLSDEEMETRAFATLGTYRKHLLDEGEVAQAAEVETILREVDQR